VKPRKAHSRTGIPPVAGVLFVGDALLCSAFIVNYWIGSPFELVNRLLNLNGEMNIPTWYSSMQLFSAAVLYGVFALRNVDRSFATRSLFLFPLFLLMFSIDEVACIHEWLGKKTDVLLPSGTRQGTWFETTGIWFFVIGVPVSALCFLTLIYLKTYYGRSRKVFRLMMIGMAIFFGGAIGVEILSNVPGSGSLGQIVEVVLEEGMEMAGVTVLIWAAHDLLTVDGFLSQLDFHGRNRQAIAGSAQDADRF
jgi:hypothetical protein